MLEYLDHPLFRLESRRVRWGQSVPQLRRYSLWVAGLVGFAMIGLWLLRVAGSPPNNVSYGGPIAESTSFIALAILISIPADIIIDLASLGFTLNSINVDDNPRWWDLLRMTAKEPASVIAAKHAVAQVRAWRVTVIVLSLRASVVILVLLHALVVETDFGLYFPPSQYMLVPTLIVFFATYVIEPYWRMRAMTALGLRISARVRNTALAALAGFGALLAVWITQGLIMAAILYLTGSLVASVAIYTEDLAICGVFFACCATSGVIYAYYRRLRASSLKGALRHTFTE